MSTKCKVVEDDCTPERLGHLVEACRSGGPDAWQELYVRCSKVVFRFVRRIGFSEADAEDIYQDAMMVLTKNIASVENPFSYVKTIASRRCVDRIRIKRVTTSLDDNFNANEESGPDRELVRVWVDQWLEQTRSVERAAANLEALDILKDGLLALGDPCKGLIQRRFTQAMSYSDLAQSENVKAQHMGMKISRCLEKLRKLLRRDNNAWTQLSELYATTR